MLPGGRGDGNGRAEGRRLKTADVAGCAGGAGASGPRSFAVPRGALGPVHPVRTYIRDSHPLRTGGTGRVPLASSATVAPAPQHLRALQQANRVRLARAELKRQVADGERTVGEIVLECPWEAESMTIGDLLQSQHRWGRTRCIKFLAALSMSETKTIGSMTDRQRDALATRLEGGEANAPFVVLSYA